VFGYRFHIIICVSDPKMCIYTEKFSNQEVFLVSFLHFFFIDRKNMKHCVYAFGGKST